jgi:hypothetical protein
MSKKTCADTATIAAKLKLTAQRRAATNFK